MHLYWRKLINSDCLSLIVGVLADKNNVPTSLFTTTGFTDQHSSRWSMYHVKDVTAHLDQKAVQSSGVRLRDLQQVASPGCFGSQSLDGPLHVRLVRSRAQYDQVLTGHAPRCLAHNTHREHESAGAPSTYRKNEACLRKVFFLNVTHNTA